MKHSVSATTRPAIQSYYLNEKQRRCLEALKEVGWELVCVRRELFPITILKNNHYKTLGILDFNGGIQRSDDIEIRQSDWSDTDNRSSMR